MEVFRSTHFLLMYLISASSMFAQLDIDSLSEIKRETAFQDAGDVIQIALPLAAGLSTVLFNDKEGFWQFTKSYGTTIAITYVLKYAINKPRPDGATDGHAFPSGHTSSAFAGASFIQRRYGWTYGIPAYALAGFVMYSRLEGVDDRHDGWDVLGGALIAIGSTYLFTTPAQQDKYQLTFKSGGGDYLLGFTIQF